MQKIVKNTCQLLLLLTFVMLSLDAYAQMFSAIGDTILDNGQPRYYPLMVSGLSPATLDAAHGLTKVCLDIAHTYDSDLEVKLIAPSGNSLDLLNRVGADGDNFTNTCFTADATTLLSNTTAPFTGTFRSDLSPVNNGATGNGTWQLMVKDVAAQDAGFLHSWNITFDTAAAAPVPLVSNLPIMIINTNGQSILNNPKIPATMRLIANENGVLNHETDPPNAYNGNIGIELRGNYSSTLPQVPYAFELRDAAQNERDTALLGMPKEHDWCLLATYNDKVFMRNPLAYKLSSEMNHYAPRTRYCELVLNGQYMGIFVLSETIKRDKNRVDIAKNDTSNNSLQGVTGGYIFKNDLYNNDGWLSNFHPLDVPGYNVHFIYNYPKAAYITVPQKNYIADFINDYETALYSNNFRDPMNGYRKYIDTRSFIDYFIIQELSRNNDGFKKSSYFHKDRDTINGKLKAGPVWDFDWAWKNINECPQLSVTNGSGWSYKVNECGPDAPSNAWNVRLLQDTVYANELHCRWQELRQTILDTVVLNHYIDSTATYLYAAQVRHYNRWQNMGQNTGSPEVTNQPPTFEACITQFKDWIATRITWLDANMPGRPCAPVVATDNVLSIDKIQVFPNPASDKITIKFAENTVENTTFCLYDITGKQVFYTNSPSSEYQTINVAILPNGVYNLTVKTSAATFKTRIIVAHK